MVPPWQPHLDDMIHPIETREYTLILILTLGYCLLIGGLTGWYHLYVERMREAREHVQFWLLTNRCEAPSQS